MKEKNKIKIIHTSDIFSLLLSSVQLLPENSEERIKDIFKAFDFIINQALDDKIDLLIIAGDTINSIPSQLLTEEFKTRIEKLNNAGIKVVINANNPGLYDLFSSKDTFVISKPKIINLEIKGQNIQIVVIPNIEDNYNDIVQELLAKGNKSFKTILVSYLFVDQSTIGAEKFLEKEKPQSITLSALAKMGMNYIALGGVFKPQILCLEPPIVYSGSIEKIHLLESKEDKYFAKVILEDNISEEVVSLVKIPVRPLYDLYLNKESNQNQNPNLKIKDLGENALNEAIVFIRTQGYSDNEIDEKELSKIQDKSYFYSFRQS